jgi:hypothetical protein
VRIGNDSGGIDHKNAPARESKRPNGAIERCDSLRKIEGDKVAITEMLKVVVQNYGMYYECAAKVDGWNDWYQEQKRIYESIK